MYVPYCAQINFGHIKIFLNGYALVCQKLSKLGKYDKILTDVYLLKKLNNFSLIFGQKKFVCYGQ